MEESKYSKKIYIILLFFTFVLIGALCKLLSSVILPVIFTILLTFSLYPPITKLNKKLKFPWVLSVTTVIVLLIGFITILSTLLVKGLSSIVSEYPKYESKFISIYTIFADQFKIPYDVEKSLLSNILNVIDIRNLLQKTVIFLSSGIFSGGKSIFLIILLLVFLLIEINSVKTRFIDYIGPKPQFDLIQIIRQIIIDVSHYLSIKFFISLATGILVFLGSLLFGLNFPIIWGFTAFIMNFIPTFGSIFSTGITTIFAIIQFYPSIGKVLIIFVYIVSVNMILGNVIEPRIEGKHLGLSPFAILISLSLFGWLWGFIGMILAVPLTVLIKIICENIPELNIVAVMLGSSKRFSIRRKKEK